MKTTLLLACILPGLTSFSQDAVLIRAVSHTTRETVALNQPAVSGILPRVLTTRAPAQMINPFAPPELGSGATYLVFGNRDVATPNHQYERRVHPDGLRLLTIRPLW